MSKTEDDHFDDVRWIPAELLACYECAVYYDGDSDTQYCARCGEELWELEKA